MRQPRHGVHRVGCCAMRAYEMCRLKLEERKVEQLERIADSLKRLEEFVVGWDEVFWLDEPKRS